MDAATSTFGERRYGPDQVLVVEHHP